MEISKRLHPSLSVDSTGNVNSIAMELAEAESLEREEMGVIYTKGAQRSFTVLEMGALSVVFMVSGPLLIMNNKTILRDFGFNFPLTLTFITLLFCSMVCWVYVFASGAKLKHADMVTKSFYVRRICPIGALSAATIVLGMASYLFLTVAFVQMVKAFTPVMTLVGLVAFRLENPSRSVVISVLTICLGTAIAGVGELNFSLIGAMCMLSAQACEALKLIYTQVVLKQLRFDIVETLYYITPTSAAFVFICAVFFEFPRMTWGNVAFLQANWHYFMMSCVFSIATNVINNVVIQFSSALVLKLAAAARNALLVMFNAFVLGEIVTPVQLFGYGISLMGFCAYNYVKSQEKKT
mmetsp:Transcript_961/g.1528  ORF Transcript_961/g.1528 Transcript_961/m.1528 type:complete len:352 (+) Transcript_961:328-1383(+)